jgi:hypothetical protein
MMDGVGVKPAVGGRGGAVGGRAAIEARRRWAVVRLAVARWCGGWRRSVGGRWPAGGMGAILDLDLPGLGFHLLFYMLPILDCELISVKCEGFSANT